MGCVTEKTKGEDRTKGEENNERYFYEATAGSRCAFRTPNQSLEPQDEALHIRCSQWHSHYRPAADGGDVQRFRGCGAQHRGLRRTRLVRRHQKAGSGSSEGRSGAVWNVPCAKSLVGW